MSVEVLSLRTAVVTGASRGIGRAIARALARHGARVHVVARTEDLLLELAKESPLLVPHVCDITRQTDVDALVKDIAECGAEPDVLVNNAGVFHLLPLKDTSVKVFEDTVGANLLAPFRLVHALLPVIQRQKRGDVITIGSVADRQIFAGNAAYSASKFGVRALHEVMRTELAGSNVRCTLISPAATDTSLWDSHVPDKLGGVPNRLSMLRPEDVADAVLWALTRPEHVNIEELRLGHS